MADASGRKTPRTAVRCSVSASTWPRIPSIPESRRGSVGPRSDVRDFVLDVEIRTSALEAQRHEVVMNTRNAIAMGICLALAAQAYAQTTPAPAQAPALASSVGLMAFPSKGQDAKTQNVDEG